MATNCAQYACCCAAGISATTRAHPVKISAATTCASLRSSALDERRAKCTEVDDAGAADTDADNGQMAK